MTYPRWTEEQAQFVFDNYMTMSDIDMAEIIGRTVRSVKNFRRKNALSTRSFWLTEDEKEFVWRARHSMNVVDMARHLRISEKRIYYYLSQKTSWRERKTDDLIRKIISRGGGPPVRSAAEVSRGYPLLDRVQILQARKKEIEDCIARWYGSDGSRITRSLRSTADKIQEAELIAKYQDVKDELRAVARLKIAA